MNFYLGIDPGITGGIAVVSDKTAGVKREYAEAHRYPGDISLAVDLLRDIHLGNTRITLAAIEQVHSMPKQGVASSFKFGMGFGAWLGALSALQIPYVLVTPRKWQKAMLDAGTGETKERSLSMARRLYPDVELKYKKDNGMADALHLARWAREQGER